MRGIGGWSLQCHPSKISLEGREIDQNAEQDIARGKVRAGLGIMSLAQVVDRLEFYDYRIFDHQIEPVPANGLIPITNYEFFFPFSFQMAALQLNLQRILIYRLEESGTKSSMNLNNTFNYRFA